MWDMLWVSGDEVVGRQVNEVERVGKEKVRGMLS